MSSETLSIFVDGQKKRRLETPEKEEIDGVEALKS